MTPFLSTARGYLSHLPDPQHRQHGLGHAAAAAPLIKLRQQLGGGQPQPPSHPPYTFTPAHAPVGTAGGSRGGLPCTRQWGGRARAPQVPMGLRASPMPTHPRHPPAPLLSLVLGPHRAPQLAVQPRAPRPCLSFSSLCSFPPAPCPGAAAGGSQGGGVTARSPDPT